MDSRLLAGAYSKRYKYIEREHIENLKENDLESSDVLVKARRLSQETNKRRKLAVQKRKQDAAREDKRRQEILNKRHQEQQQATEKYQRCHVKSRPQFSFQSHEHNIARKWVNLEDALRSVRGGTRERSPETTRHIYRQRQNSSDAVDRSYAQLSQSSKQGHQEVHQGQKRPQSGRPLDAAKRAELIKRSLRNLTSSRSHFEEQLAQHQQLLAEQQQKSLQEFDQAIRQEIDSDTKVQGIEDDEINDTVLRSESLSSLDSLEEDNVKSQSNLPQTLLTHKVGEQQKDAHLVPGEPDLRTLSAAATITRNMGVESGLALQPQLTQLQSAEVPAVRCQQDQILSSGFTGGSHIVGPVSKAIRVPPSSTAAVQGSLSSYPDSLDFNHPSQGKRVTVGTALRLPQQSSVVSQVKQPEAPLVYDSQLPTYGQFTFFSDHRVKTMGTKQFSDSGDRDETSQGTKSFTSRSPFIDQRTSPNDLSVERPKAHVFAWTSPPPVENEKDQKWTPSYGITDKRANNISSGYAVSGMTDNITKTSMHTPVSQNVTLIYSEAATNNYSHVDRNVSPSSQKSAIENALKEQEQKSATISTSAVPSSAVLKSERSDLRQQSHLLAHEKQKQLSGASIYQGTLGLVNGRLTVINHGQIENTSFGQKITLVKDHADAQKEVRGILKSKSKEQLPKETKVGQKFAVHDSIELAKKHLQHSVEVRIKKIKKKGVRFADIQYGDKVAESVESADDMSDAEPAATTIAKTESGTEKAETILKSPSQAQHARPASAKVVSTTLKPADGVKAPRVASAGPTRQPTIPRPRAAAHIIMSGDASSWPCSSGKDFGSSSITVHKSQLDKKVTLINHNFMSRKPKFTSATTTTPVTMVPNSNAVVGDYLVTNDRNNSFQPASCVTTVGLAAAVPDGSSRILLHTHAADQGRVGLGNKSTAPAPHTTNAIPSHGHFTNANNSSKIVFNENGLRIDRTPTDDEINNLWKNMRSILDVNDVRKAPSASSNVDQVAKQPVHVSHQYIDGASLGIAASMGRVMPAYTNVKLSPSNVSNGKPGQTKLAGQAKSGYLQRFTLLQQRRNQTSGTATLPHASSVEQTVKNMQPLGTNGIDQQHTAVNISYAPREEISESMAGFLAAEQMVQSHGANVRDSRVISAIESAQNQQEMYNSIRQKVSKGGPSALSMEEQRLLESLEKLNDRLKAVEHRPTNSQQVTNYSNTPTGQQIYIHGSGFRGRHIISSPLQRRNSYGSMGRSTSARLLTRPHH